MRSWWLESLMVVIALFALVARAEQPTTDYSSLRINVTGVQGLVQVRDASDQPWRKCEVGMTVGAGAEFRTGPRSAVRCEIPPDQTFTIDRRGVMKVLTAIQQGGKVKTDIAMTYGRTRYDIEQAGIEHESTIRSPSGTLAIRGTRVSLYDQPPFTPQAVSLTGRAMYSSAKRQVAFGGKGQGKTTVNSGQASAAETAAAIEQIQAVMDPRSAIELTQAESRQIAFEVSRGGIRFDRLLIGGFVPPPSELGALGILPGKLNFVATLSGFAELDLFLIVNPNSSNQKILGNPSVAGVVPGLVQSRLPDGGRLDFDKISTGKGEFEVAYWPSATYKGGVYGLGAIHQDFRNKDPQYDAISDVKFEVYLDGKKLDTIVTNPDAVRDQDAAVKFGTTYQTQTNLDTGRDVVSTLAVIPDPSGSKRSGRRRAATPSAAAVPVPPVTPATPRRR
jgi:hypothetical protein